MVAYYQLHGCSAAERRCLTSLEGNLNLRNGSPNTKTRRAQRCQDNHQVERLVTQATGEAPSVPPGRLPPGIDPRGALSGYKESVRLTCVRVDIQGELHKRRPGVGELQEQRRTDQSLDSLDLGNGGTDEEGDPP